MSTIIFVCTGNTCRSPMAEVIARSVFPANHTIYSRGLNVSGDAPASDNAVAAVATMGIDLSNHVSKQFSDHDAQNADVIVTMTLTQRMMLETLYPRNYIRTLADKDVSDPFGGDLPEYMRTADEIRHYVERLFADIGG